MITYPQFDPVAFHIGSLSVNWYGLAYLFGFMMGWLLLAFRIKKSLFSRGFTLEQLSDMIFYAGMGTILGGRLGYMVVYAWPELIAQPWSLFEIWKGGMSFHGGLFGVIFALWLYARKIHRSLFDLTDFLAPAVPIGLAAGRLTNFVNGELWGRITDVPWAMVFPYGGPHPRHPSQLYEFLLEGILLFIILWAYSRKPRPRGAVSGWFLICYSGFRFIVEFFREPDVQMGFVGWGWLTTGQLLSIPLFIVGALLLCMALIKPKYMLN